jgi:hypothetical protein
MLGHLHLLPPPDLSETLPHRLGHQVVVIPVLFIWGLLVLIPDKLVVIEVQSLLRVLSA